MAKQFKCSACGATIEGRDDGIQLWDTWFCTKCFIAHSASTHRELTAADIELIKQIGREMSGLIPRDIVEMVFIGFHKRSTKSPKGPPEEELARAVGEMQRLTAFACFRRVLNLLKTWQDVFNDFVDTQEKEIRDSIKRLTDLE